MRKHAFGTLAIARMCQVTPRTIARWAEEGHLPCFTTLGGHRKVWDVDLAAFLKDRNIPLPAELRYVESKKVLIVDDEEPVRKVIKRVLQKMDPTLEVTEAVDGFDAGSKLAELIPTLVILDIRLPGADGYQVCKAIREHPRLKSITILAISGHDVEESRRRSLNVGADDFLAKPFARDELKEKISRLLGVE